MLTGRGARSVVQFAVFAAAGRPARLELRGPRPVREPDGERFAAQVFAALPPNAVLVTYWDALTPLSYKHCVEGVRPDVTLRAYDEAALVTCDPSRSAAHRGGEDDVRSTR